MMNDTSQTRPEKPDTMRADIHSGEREHPSIMPEGGVSESGGADAAPPRESEDPAVVLARELAESRDRTLRTLAEMENLRKRTEREVADARAYGISAFARDMLDIADNIRRALEAVPAEAVQAGDAGLKTLIEGVELTERALLQAMEKNGVRRFDPKGERFNPNLHQAMYEVPDATVAPGTVAQVVQAGYMIRERVLRPALVAVAKAPPKASEQGG